MCRCLGGGAAQRISTEAEHMKYLFICQPVEANLLPHHLLAEVHLTNNRMGSQLLDFWLVWDQSGSRLMPPHAEHALSIYIKPGGAS